jgi:NADPH:quinone reductase-like Zn-dependent oxidoreductase
MHRLGVLDDRWTRCQVPKTGGPEVLTLAEIPVPTPKDHEVLIKVNWTWVRRRLWSTRCFDLGSG